MPLTPVLTTRWGADKPWKLATYERLEGYTALRQALAMAPDELVAMVKDSGLRDEAPLHAGREARAAAAAQARVLDHGDQLVGRHGERLPEGGVALEALVGRELPRPVGAPPGREDGGEGHGQASRFGASVPPASGPW